MSQRSTPERPSVARRNPDEPPKKTGRPTLYRPEYVEQVRKLCALGAIDDDIAEFFEVGVRTVKDWRVRYKEFAEACKLGKDVADQRVEDSLFRMATGYRIETEKLFCHNGEIVRGETYENVSPSASAAIFWLKNRQGWRDQQDLKHSGNVTVTAGPLDEAI
jgi:hypothetical protein